MFWSRTDVDWGDPKSKDIKQTCLSTFVEEPPGTAISFISPIYVPSPGVADYLEITRKLWLSYAVCGETEAKLFFAAPVLVLRIVYLNIKERIGPCHIGLNVAFPTLLSAPEAAAPMQQIYHPP